MDKAYISVYNKKTITIDTLDEDGYGGGTRVVGSKVWGYYPEPDVQLEMTRRELKYMIEACQGVLRILPKDEAVFYDTETGTFKMAENYSKRYFVLFDNKDVIWLGDL